MQVKHTPSEGEESSDLSGEQMRRGTTSDLTTENSGDWSCEGRTRESSHRALPSSPPSLNTNTATQCHSTPETQVKPVRILCSSSQHITSVISRYFCFKYKPQKALHSLTGWSSWNPPMISHFFTRWSLICLVSFTVYHVHVGGISAAHQLLSPFLCNVLF